MHGTDADVDPSELELVKKLVFDRSEKLSDGQKSNGNNSSDQILDEVMLMYVGRTSAEMLAASIVSLKQSLPDADRIQILQDLANIASADGVLYPNEVQFIVGVAKQWGMEDFLSSTNTDT